MRRVAALAAAVLLSAMALQGRGADFAAAYEEAGKTSPPGVKFLLSVGKKTFHQGEIIPVTLSFSSQEEERWQLDAATYDRSGRLGSDGYVLNLTEGTADPLAGYFEGLISGGGLRSMPMLGEKPTVMNFQLNEWVRFDKPGKYKLFVTSYRVSDFSKEKHPQVPVTSNMVEFEVLPADAAWEAAELDRIRAALSAEDFETTRAAARRLRFLGTPAAAMELAKRLDDPNFQWDYKFGLIGMRDRAAALEAARTRLTAPDQKITPMYLETLGWLEELSARRAETQPADMAALGKRWREHTDARVAAADKALNTLAEILPMKTEAAKATCLQALLAGTQKLTAEHRKGLGKQMPSVWNELTYPQRITAMAEQWDAIKSREMLPLLLAGYATKEFPEKFYYTGAYRNLCLKRAYELDPPKVRPMILEALKSSPTKFGTMSMDALLMLPDATMTDLEPAWVEALEQGWDLEVYSILMRRYGSKQMLPRMQKLFETAPGRWECNAQVEMLAYFLRVSPEYGVKQVKFCVAARGKNFSGCWSELLRQLSERIWTSDVEAICIDALEDGDAGVIAKAAGALAKRGLSDCRNAMLKALAKPWEPTGTEEGKWKQMIDYREWAFVSALTNAKAWLLTDAEMEKLAGLLKSENAKREMANYRSQRAGRIDLQIQNLGPGKLRGNVLSQDWTELSEAEAKMLQYPKGTIFKLTVYKPDEDDEARKAIEAFARQRGFTLE